MSDPRQDKLSIRIHVKISAATLQAIVANAKQTADKAAGGGYHVDTADKVGEMVSRFLQEKDFESFVQDIRNYISK